MKLELICYVNECQKALQSFKSDQVGIIALEYAIIVAGITAILAFAIQPSGVFYNMIFDVWIQISDIVISKLTG